MTAALQIAASILAIPLDLIDPSPTNPRKTFTGVEELAESLKLRGVVVPLILRASGKRYECVDGERRYRAAKAAKLATVPAQVRELSDLEVLEIQIVSYAQRADVHPVEEAEAYRQLRDTHKLSVAEISAKVGRPVGTVYERLKLCELAPEVRKAALAGELPASHAVLIARIPDKKLQAEALAQIVGKKGEEAVSYRDALALIHGSFMLRLADAPFDIADAQLVPKAGACTTCPKRTGNQRELFSEVKSPDICTDPTCHIAKVDALWKLKVKQAEESGQKVLSAEQSKKLFPDYMNGEVVHNAPLYPLDQKVWNGDKHVTAAELLKKETDLKPVLARDNAGKIREVVPRELVDKAIQEAHKKRDEARPKNSGGGSTKDPYAAEKRRLEIKKAVVNEVLGKLAEKGEQDARGAFLSFVVWTVMNGVSLADGVRAAVVRRGLKQKGEHPGSVMEKEIARGLTDEGLRGWIVEVIAGDNAHGGLFGAGYGHKFEHACKHFGIDLKKAEAHVKEARDAQKRAKEDAKAARVKKVAPAAKAAKPKKGKRK
jgi:ParB/RepB/Spo0J family partition protein